MTGNSSSIEGVIERRPSPQRNILYRILRHGMFKRLERFTTGHIRVLDGAIQRSFGNAQADLQATLHVIDPRFYARAAAGGSIGAAEAFINREVHTDNLVDLIRIFARNQDRFTPTERRIARLLRPAKRWAHHRRRNTKTGSRRNIIAHYDLGNDFYSLFLDPTMTYSCAVFEPETLSLEAASCEKLDRICRKLDLTADDHLLEIGSGWGSMALHAVQNYGCRVTTTTISDRQYEYVRRLAGAHGLSDRITVLKKDYRDLTGQYDKIVSIEMIEAVGHEYVPDYLSQCDQLLRPGGKMAIQAITMDDRYYHDYRKSVDFIQHYMFPGACLLSFDHFHSSLKAQTGMRLEHTEDITRHYAATLAQWRSRFSRHQAEITSLGFSDRFIRTWEYYFAYCEAGFREGRIGNVQLLLDKPR